MADSLPDKHLTSPLVQHVPQDVTGIQCDVPDGPALGLPQPKPRVERINAMVTVASFALLGVAAVIVDPRTQLAWSLTLKQQLTAIGFILSLQGIGLARLYSKTFPLLEARFGASRLQNYEAILANSITTNRASKEWRAIILLALAIPLGLSAAYKQFTTGLSSQTIPSAGHEYGPTGPPGLNLGYHTGAALMNNLTTPFMAASTNDTNVKQALTGLPRPFGFNLLLLGNESAAFLDGPSPETVLQIQNSLAGTETYQLNAAVNGLVAYHNATLDQLRDSDTFWSDPSLPRFAQQTNTVLNCQDLYTNFKVCLYAWNLDVRDHTWCMLSVQPSNASDSDADAFAFDTDQFKQSAQLFNFTYQNCEATWSITSSSIELANGSCSGTVIPWSAAPWYRLDATNMALQNWFMPSLSEMLGLFAVDRNGSAWQLPTMVVAAGGMTYARVSVLNLNSTQMTYHLADTITSQRIVMSNPAALYVVLAAQPVLTLVMFAVTYALYASPLGTGFGLTALLAGVDPTSLGALKGAGFSGKLSRGVPVRITLESLSDAPHDGVRGKGAQVVYTINSAPSRERSRWAGGASRGQELY